MIRGILRLIAVAVAVGFIVRVAAAATVWGTAITACGVVLHQGASGLTMTASLTSSCVQHVVLLIGWLAK